MGTVQRLAWEAQTLEKLQKRVEHDLYYIENWSVVLDIVVILKTASRIFTADDEAV